MALAGVAVAVAALTSACSTLGYYWQAAQGERALLAARRPLASLVADPETPPALRARLQLAEQARAFASNHLHLPRNASYTDYADLGRAYAVWNVYATPEFSVQPVQHCFPIAGCVAYRGYFHEADADAAAARWHARGDDVAVIGAPAFSTLGWFDDPVLSTMLRWGGDALAGQIFHELAHQQFYVKGDTQFNESWANFVEQEGLRQWRVKHGTPADAGVARARSRAFTQLMLSTRAELAALYAQPLAADVMRARKQALFAQLEARYRKLRDTQWDGYAGYDAFFNRPLNNAALVPFGIYDAWVPGFRELFLQQAGSWPAFYAAVAHIGKQDKAKRDAEMTKLTSVGTASTAASIGVQP
ncbi:MAG: aminopeptidase [Nevskiaceae bacterium]|nr:MAG: aminopeptidase [Nevskiaceae bacterium]TBR74341.1 MAG: aminopeptidase [Nevskiaceae bacterium]